MPDQLDQPDQPGQPDQIAYTGLQPGTPVQTSDEQQFGTVEAVLHVEDLDVFDGLVVQTAQGTRFVDADQVSRIFTSHVLTTLTPAEAADLPEPGQTSVYEVDSPGGGSFGDRLGRLFGRGGKQAE